MPNEENEKAGFGNTFAAIAWAQLLVGVTAVAREDMRKLGAFWTDLTTHWSPLNLTPENLGAPAVALNVSAVSFLTALVILENGRTRKRARSGRAGIPVRILEMLGYFSWYLSALFYLGYLNPVFIYFGLGALGIALVIEKMGRDSGGKR